ncbi:MAG: hypothetical protein V1816_19995 [Pseudomonadota bacterium]
MEDFIFEKASPRKTPSVSAHRAFFYAAAVPGWGDYYSGNKARGAGTFIVFVGLTAWLTQLGLLAARLLIDYASSYLVEGGPADWNLVELPTFQLGLALSGLYAAWLWGIFSGVGSAVGARRDSSAPPQVSAAWSAAMSWLCPGSGQAYTGRSGLGAVFLLGYLGGLALLFPAYEDLLERALSLVRAGDVGDGGLEALTPQLSVILYHLDLSPAKLIQLFVGGLALADAMSALSPEWARDDGTWASHPAARTAGLFILGWLGPGTGQILQGRGLVGWSILGAWLGSFALCSLMFRGGAITAPEVATWFKVSDWIMYGAMLEAPVVLVLRNLKKASGGI